MAGLRGPDSSKDAQLLDERAVFPETVDVNIRQLDPIPAPRYFLKELPLTNEMSDLVLKSRQEIRDVLHGRDDRLLAIVGPCSIHDPKAAHEYAERLAAVKKELDDRLVIVMRVYFEKPRTTIGWKGLINDPDLDGQFNIRKGMFMARKVLTDVLGLGLPAATEWLDPITPQYICDLISWGAIGARNTESQVHRELASGMSMPIGFKNATDGSIKPAADSCFAAAFEHHFLSINLDGRVISAETKGQSRLPSGAAWFLAWSELRCRFRGPSVGGSQGFQGFRTKRAWSDHRCRARQLRQERGARGRSGRRNRRTRRGRRTGHSRHHDGSFLKAGNQKPAPLDQLEYGKSITDACVPWDRTEQLLHTLADAVDARRKLG